MTTKPQPQTDEQHTARICPKCGGTGFFCNGVLDGRPVSNTGFDCWTCGGKGWKIVWKRGARKAFWDSIEPVKVEQS